MNRAEDKLQSSDGIGWEAALAIAALLSLLVSFGIQSLLGPIQALSVFAGAVAIASAVVSILLAIWEMFGRLGLLLLACCAVAGSWILLH